MVIWWSKTFLSLYKTFNSSSFYLYLMFYPYIYLLFFFILPFSCSKHFLCKVRTLSWRWHIPSSWRCLLCDWASLCLWFTVDLLRLVLIRGWRLTWMRYTIYSWLLRLTIFVHFMNKLCLFNMVYKYGGAVLSG
jgi:hypothetical protein